jgi:hypothetical protein
MFGHKSKDFFIFCQVLEEIQEMILQTNEVRKVLFHRYATFLQRLIAPILILNTLNY